MSVPPLRRRSLRPGSLPLAASIRRLPRARWSPSSIRRRPGPNSPHRRVLGSPAAGPGAPCHFVRVIWVLDAPSHRIVDRAGPGSTWPQWRGRRRAGGVPAGGHPTLHRVLATRHQLDPRPLTRGSWERSCSHTAPQALGRGLEGLRPSGLFKPSKLARDDVRAGRSHGAGRPGRGGSMLFRARLPGRVALDQRRHDVGLFVDDPMSAVPDHFDGHVRPTVLPKRFGESVVQVPHRVVTAG